MTYFFQTIIKALARYFNYLQHRHNKQKYNFCSLNILYKFCWQTTNHIFLIPSPSSLSLSSCPTSHTFPKKSNSTLLYLHCLSGPKKMLSPHYHILINITNTNKQTSMTRTREWCIYVWANNDSPHVYTPYDKSFYFPYLTCCLTIDCITIAYKDRRLGFSIWIEWSIGRHHISDIFTHLYHILLSITWIKWYWYFTILNIWVRRLFEL